MTASPEDELSARVAELELRYLEQEKLLQELSEVLYGQTLTLERLTTELKHLRLKVVDPGVMDGREQERPPHY